jgi:hypothetical protein
VNKLQEFEKGVQRANRLAQIGFWQVYLWVFVLVDSRKQNAGRITYAGPTPKLSAQIKRVISAQQLHERVGLDHHEFVQPMDYEPLDIGTFGSDLLRLATAVSQPPEVTAWVDDISRLMPN